MSSGVSTADSSAARRVIAALSAVVMLLIVYLVYLMPPGRSTTTPHALATINAGLNGSAGLCLVAGWFFIRRRQLGAHRRCMVAAVALSTAFLLTYVMHHYQVGSVPFQGVGPIRWIYFSLLIPHIVLAAVVLPLALLTFYRGWTDRRAAHRAIARWTLPLWLYVSFSGVAVYWMLYHL